MPNSNSIRESVSRSNSPGSDEGVTASPTDSNPSMDKPDVTSAATTSSKAKSKDHHTHLYGNDSAESSVSIIAENQLLLFLHLGFGALAALKRKRKKFSRSRNTSPILEPPHSQEADSSSAVCDGIFCRTENHNSIELFIFLQILKRASSVPSRVALDPKDANNASLCTTKQDQPIQQESIDTTTIQSGLSQSTTDESVKATTSNETTLRQSITTPEMNINELLPHLPNITPVRGHTYQGWL